MVHVAQSWFQWLGEFSLSNLRFLMLNKLDWFKWCSLQW